ncbi:hypothetical protein DCCM_0153 [Desulfocucumis palustris]|uniref:Uncharacterized protein n=1 Tax=Desulfocucumis palustris TaxID=1898651 RepID=A0A2L2X8Q8_9FIRM|nr:hypothetical protein [Desulfocucumis palustris]GBF31963.1 hypothetical protein DCCM_0153 [Desulfocucumis palustris]
MENSPLFDGIQEEWEAKGEAKGREHEKMEVAIKMLQLNLEIETIIKTTGLERVQIEKLIKQQGN